MSEGGVQGPNFVNRTLWTGDNLDILRGLNSATVDLIYLDPPFNSNKTYAAPVGSKAAGAAFKDTWHLSDLDVAWMGLIADEQPAIATLLDAAGQTHSKGMQSYLTMMAVRLLELRRVLKDTGSLYLHCDPVASHYLKQLLDAVFGRRNFRNEIVWSYRRWSIRSKKLPSTHDCLILYGRTKNVTWTPIEIPNVKPNPSQYVSTKDASGKTVVKRDAQGHAMKRKIRETIPVGDVWDMPIISPNGKERVGYPTQKPLALLERIIRASSNEGDIVLDPFAGCATACVAAERLGRQWVGIDLSPKAVELVRARLSGETSNLTYRTAVIDRTDIPRRTDIDAPKNYRQNKHVLYGQQEGRCGGCAMDFPFKIMEVDHVVPQSKGGGDHMENLQLLCSHCNRVKGDKPMEHLVAELTAAGH